MRSALTMPLSRLFSQDDAADAAIDNLERATARARERRGPQVSNEDQYMRYQELSQDPTKLFDFVRRSINSSDPEKVRRGAVNYLSEMRNRFGGE